MLMSRGSRREIRRKIFGKDPENGAGLGGLTRRITQRHISPAHVFLSSPEGLTARKIRQAMGGREGEARGNPWNSSGAGRLEKAYTPGKGRRQTCSPSLVQRS